MDAHSFRIVGAELVTLLSGSRVEKIHGPFPQVFVFQIFAQGKKIRVVLRAGRQNPLLFLCRVPFANPAEPRSDVMRLRKYVGGRRIGRGSMDFVARQLCFPILEAGEETGNWLLLDMRHGPMIRSALPDNFAQEVRWPDLHEVVQACQREGKEASAVWQEYPILTPLLRETLSVLELPDAKALLVDLEAGGGNLFYYGYQAGTPDWYVAWPLPESLQQRKKLVMAACPAQVPDQDFPFMNTLQASSIDSARFFAQFEEVTDKEAARPLIQEKKKKQRLLAKLDQEEARLQAMCALREVARLLQAHLWRFGQEERLEEVTLPALDGEESEVSARTIQLNELLTVRENMLWMFKQSARGMRGLKHLAERRGQINGPEQAYQGGGAETSSSKSEGKNKGQLVEEKDIARFISSDGYVLLRGKSSKGNARALRLAKPYDFWLHTQSGPSAHVIIRRKHPADDVPERTLQEACILTGLRSWQRDDMKAEVSIAEVRHVRAIKGAPSGAVQVSKTWRTMMVELDASLEQALQ